jgi:hypothetical protein
MMGTNRKWVRPAIFASLLIDMLIILALIIFVGPVYGILAGAILVVGNFITYRVLLGSRAGAGTTDSAVTSPEKLRESADLVKSAEAVNDAISASGLPADATVLKSWELGINVNGKNPMMQFLLEVRPADRPAFQASATCVVSGDAIAGFQPGSEIFVKYDLKDLTRVAIEHS